MAVLALLRTPRLNWLMLMAAVAPAWRDLLLCSSSGCFELSNSQQPLSVHLHVLDVAGQVSAPHLSLSTLLPYSWSLKALLANGSAGCRPQT